MNSRRPKALYKGKNGFEQQILPKEGCKDAEAVEVQDFARFVIREMGSHFPSFEEMKAQVEADDCETVASVQARIKRLKKEHDDVMSKLSAYYAQSVDDDARDQYFQTDDLRYFDDLPRDDEWTEHYARLEAFFRRYGVVQNSEFKNVLGRAQYDHLQTLLPLYKKRAELSRQEEQARIVRAAQFPQTINEFRSVEFRDAQLRVARFLMGDESKREQMRNESQWAWRQTEPLMREYTNNKEFHKEIEQLVRANESRDPRSRH